MLRADIGGGVVLEYEVFGRGEPIVFIHGALIADSFRPLITEPALAGYQLVVYHRRGYGNSSPATDLVTFAQAADDCAGLLHALGIEHAHMVGHSFGGSVALRLALQHSERVHTLTLLEAGLFVGATAQGYRDALAANQQRYRDAGAEIATDEFMRVRFGDGYRGRFEREVPGAFAQAVANAATCFEQELPGAPLSTFEDAELRSITQPALVVLGGDSDALWPRFGETYRTLLRTLPHAEGFILPRATHGMQLDNPRDMADALAAFCARHPI